LVLSLLDSDLAAEVSNEKQTSMMYQTDRSRLPTMWMKSL
jgi:hypothetical protein